MSGGSLDYIEYKLEDLMHKIRKHGKTKYEPLLIDLLESLMNIFHNLEWWYSGDLGEYDFIRACLEESKSIERFAEGWKKESHEMFRILDELSKKDKKQKVIK